MICTALLTKALAQDPAVRSTKERTVVKGTDYPWRAIGRLQWAAIGNRAHCTGTLIGRTVVITAAHCLYNLSQKQWVDPAQVHFVAGYDRGEFVAHSVAKKLRVSPDFDPKIWNSTSNIPNDWALVKLEKPIGDDIGFIGWQPFSFDDFMKIRKKQPAMILAGYPSDRAHVLSVENSCLLESFDPSKKLFLHTCRLSHGDSGGPFAILNDGKLSLLGLNNAVLGNVELNISSAVALGPLKNEIIALLKEDGTLVSSTAKPHTYGWTIE